MSIGTHTQRSAAPQLGTTLKTLARRFIDSVSYPERFTVTPEEVKELEEAGLVHNLGNGNYGETPLMRQVDLSHQEVEEMKISRRVKMSPQSDIHVMFPGHTDTEPAYGVKGVFGGVIYEANMVRDTAIRIAELLNSSYPPEDWAATEPILVREGYDVRCVTAEWEGDEEVSDGRRHLPPELTVRQTSGSLMLAGYQVDVVVDSSGVLSCCIRSLNHSEVIPIDTAIFPGGGLVSRVIASR
jgi:hypothetical protein